MINFIINKFIENKDCDELYKRARYANVSSIIGIILNLFLSISKIFCGVFFNSTSVLGDGLNNLSDATSSVVAMLGFKMSLKPADKDHPFGHARMEYISGLIISFIIMFIGYELITSSFVKIFNKTDIQYSNIILVTLIISMIIKFWLYKFNNKIAKIINSTTIKATASDSINDVFITAGVLFSILIYKIFNINIDAYVSIILGVLIIKSAIDIIKDTLSKLLGEAPNSDFVQSVKEKILSYENVLGIHDLIVHAYGYGKNFASVHVEVDYKIDSLITHELSDEIERDFKKNGLNLVVHIDPIITDCEESNKYKKIVIDIIEKIDTSLTIHDFRVVFGGEFSNLIFDIVIPCEVKISDDEIIEKIKVKIKERCPECYVIIEIDKHYN